MKTLSSHPKPRKGQLDAEIARLFNSWKSALLTVIKTGTAGIAGSL
jgi:hypothetical protein